MQADDLRVRLHPGKLGFDLGYFLAEGGELRLALRDRHHLLDDAIGDAADLPLCRREPNLCLGALLDGAGREPLAFLVVLGDVDCDALAVRQLLLERARHFRLDHVEVGQTMWGTGVEQINLSWLTLGLRGYLKRIEAAINRSLIRPEERKTLSAEFVVEGLLRADAKTRFELYSSMTQNGIRTRNEVRELENLPRVDGGDELTVQSNLVPLHMLGKTQAASTSPVNQSQDDEEDGSVGRRPFDETKAFDPGKHPRDENGKFSGRGAGRGRRARRLVRRSVADKKFQDTLDLGRVEGGRFDAAAGVSTDGWRFALRSDEVRHIHSHHGGARERLRGQEPIGPADFANLPRVLNGATTIKASDRVSKRLRQSVIEVEHVIGPWRYHVDLAVLPRRKALVIQSMRKRKK